MPILRYSNSEIREMLKRVKHDITEMTEEMPKAGGNWMSYLLVRRALESLNIILSRFKTHIIDNYDLSCAVALNDIITPAWTEYWKRVEQNEFEVHEVAWEVRYIVDDLREWISEEKQRRAIALEHALDKAFKDVEESPKVVEEKKAKITIDIEKLRSLFLDSFMVKDIIISGYSPIVEKTSRFDELIQRLELVLEDAARPVTQQDIGSIAYMMYQSTFIKPKFGEPKRKGTKGRFAPLLKMLFDIVGKPYPKDTRQNKYKPNEEMVSYFGFILKWEQ